MKMYVARDVCNTSLRLFFDRKPIMHDGNWIVYYIENGQCTFLDGGIDISTSLFPEVTFENSPMEVELVIKNVCSKS